MVKLIFSIIMVVVLLVASYIQQEVTVSKGQVIGKENRYETRYLIIDHTKEKKRISVTNSILVPGDSVKVKSTYTKVWFIFPVTRYDIKILK
jgi:hypothetical protein